MNHISALRRRARRGFTLMELLVVIAIIAILAAIAYPVIMGMRSNAYKAEATQRLGALGSALKSYVALNNGDLPSEDSTGVDDWTVVKKPEAVQAWYNALPKILNQKSPADYANEGRTDLFYQKENILYLPGAVYPEKDRKIRPYFAICINTKLHRKEASGDDGDRKKRTVKMAGILQPERTVMFLEQGLPGETAAHPAISVSSDYDGSCKGSAKSFVARYKGKGVIAFADGHAELVAAKDLLTETGGIIWDATLASSNGLRYIWTPDPQENPNK
jgi:prepilin-type N-terminal cleavage/methylation domain-containing protein/prepilin-type processing-associated H-X9-DG protein